MCPQCCQAEGSFLPPNSRARHDVFCRDSGVQAFPHGHGLVVGFHPSEEETKVLFIVLQFGDGFGPVAVNERSSSFGLGDEQELRR